MNPTNHTGQNQISWLFRIVVVVLALVVFFALGVYLRGLADSVVDRPFAVPNMSSTTPMSPTASHQSSTATSVPIVGDVALRQFREFEQWAAGRQLDARSEFLRLVKMRQDSSIGEKWEEAAAAELASLTTAKQFAENKLIAAALRAFYEQSDSGFFLRANLLSGDAQSSSNTHREVWSRWFSKLDKYDGCLMARRYLCERLADFIAVRTAAEPISLLTLDQQKFPLLNWAAKLQLVELRQHFERLDPTAMPFANLIDCDAAELVVVAWPSINSEETLNNPVERANSGLIGALRQQLRAERDKKLEGVSEEQRESSRKVFEAIDQFLSNEEERNGRIHNPVWKKDRLQFL